MYSKKIVFTGGPCAGKTKIINAIRSYLIKKGYDVIIVPETATELFGTGIKYSLINDVPKYQKLIFDYQRYKECSVDNVLDINKNSDKKIVILYDRGILDNKAYFKDYTGFDKILKRKYKELDFLDNYDFVFDLITLADCNPDKYNLSSNEARSESIEDAIKIDRKTSSAWVGHRNMKIINSSISLEDEIDLIKQNVDEILNENNIYNPEKIEIENDILDFSQFNDNNSRTIDTEEIFIDVKNNYDMMFKIIKRTYKKHSTYILNVSYEQNGKKVVICDEKISHENFVNIIDNYKVSDIIKFKQISFAYERQLYDVKFYDDKTILEYEENKLNNGLNIPDFIKRKVTDKILKLK